MSSVSARGCGICITGYQFGAATTIDSKAVVDKEKCFGCGLCASKCSNNAVQLILVRGPEHIVDNLEKAPPKLIDTLIIE